MRKFFKNLFSGKPTVPTTALTLDQVTQLLKSNGFKKDEDYTNEAYHYWDYRRNENQKIDSRNFEIHERFILWEKPANTFTFFHVLDLIDKNAPADVYGDQPLTLFEIVGVNLYAVSLSYTLPSRTLSTETYTALNAELSKTTVVGNVIDYVLKTYQF